MKRIDLLSIIENGGATVNGSGDRVYFANGYQVSKKDCFVLDVGNVDAILEAVNVVLATMNSVDFCGLWVENGKIYIDVSECVEDRTEALQIGRARSQISVFDWATGDCVYC